MNSSCTHQNTNFRRPVSQKKLENNFTENLKMGQNSWNFHTVQNAFVNLLRVIIPIWRYLPINHNFHAETFFRQIAHYKLQYEFNFTKFMSKFMNASSLWLNNCMNCKHRSTKVLPKIIPQWRNFMIFVSSRFYVKSILKILEGQN